MRPRFAFSLVELMVVIAIIAMVMAIVLPAIMKVRTAAERMVCQSNLRQLGVALQHYHDSKGKGTFPPAVCSERGYHEALFSHGGWKDKIPPRHPDNKFHISWLARTLPYVERDALYQTINWSPAPHVLATISNNRHVTGVRITPFECPSDRFASKVLQWNGLSLAMTSYLAVTGTNQIAYDGVMYVNSRHGITHVSDGTSYTLLVGERPVSPDNAWGWWFSNFFPNGMDSCLGVNEVRFSAAFPKWDEIEQGRIGPNDRPLIEMRKREEWIYEDGDWSTDDYKPTSENPTPPARGDVCHYWSYHPGGANFLFVDGSIRNIRYTVGQDMINRLATRAGDEPIGKHDCE